MNFFFRENATALENTQKKKRVETKGQLTSKNPSVNPSPPFHGFETQSPTYHDHGFYTMALRPTQDGQSDRHESAEGQQKNQSPTTTLNGFMTQNQIPILIVILGHLSSPKFAFFFEQQVNL